jgi:signal transduction histidine kinase
LKGLRLQLALFYVVLSIPALLVIERAVIGWKFERLMHQLDDGRVQALLWEEAHAFSAALRGQAREDELSLRLENLVLRLERPRETLGTSVAFVLLELTRHPFRAQLLRPQQAPLAAGFERLPREGWVQRRWALPLVEGADISNPPRLEIELAVPSPWRLSKEAMSFEWPLAVAYLLIFLLGSAWFLRWRVLGRVSQMADAAGAWARGDFSVSLADPAADELGSLARALDRMAADLQALVDARARLASLEERQRLARDLHDTVKQKAFALSLQLAAARDSGSDSLRVQQRLAEAQSLAAEIQHELSELLLEMRGLSSSLEDVVPLLRQRATDFERRSGCAVSLTVLDALLLRSDQREALLRAVDEALGNVLKHAAASEVQIRLRRQAERIELSICDNGRGCAPASDPGTGMGMGNMRERAAQLPGGSLQVRAGCAGGTEVVLSFLPPAEPTKGADL